MVSAAGHTIVGTAGHIDHGKTALIKALTGFDTDTLAEEKQRGITIELGFAFLSAPGLEKEIVFVDVPGHEKLIKTMVAGASNLDGVLLVVAADEGIGVQTIEHLDILQLFGIPTGVIALTKSDLVDADRLRSVTADIKALTAATFMADAPVVPCSAVTGEGVDAVKSALVEMAGKVRKRGDTGVFRMPVDRVFTMHGFGTVVAGTILSGEVKVGDKLEVLPEGLTSRVRGIQVHAKSIDKSVVGTRTAINLQDIKKEQLRRGQCAAAPGTLAPTNRLDVRLHALKSCGEEIRNRARVRFHVGADEVMARLVLVDREKLSPGESGLAQFVLESLTTAMAKDRFVIRGFSSMRAVGGGVVLDAHPRPHKRLDETVIEKLSALESDASSAMEQVFLKSGVTPLSISKAASAVGISEDEAAGIVSELDQAGSLVQVGSSQDYIHVDSYRDLARKLVGIIEDYYSRNPYRILMPVADLQSRFGKMASKPVYETIVARLAREGIILEQTSRIGLAKRQIDWKPGEKELAQRIERVYEQAGYATPPDEDVVAELGVRPATFESIMTALIDQGRLVRLAERVTYHADALGAARAIIVAHIKKHGSVTAAELRDMMGVTRKYAIALLEYLDNSQVTRRLGDKRVLR